MSVLSHPIQWFIWYNIQLEIVWPCPDLLIPASRFLDFSASLCPIVHLYGYFCNMFLSCCLVTLLECQCGATDRASLSDHVRNSVPKWRN